MRASDPLVRLNHALGRLVSAALKPEYVYRPRQLLHRLYRHTNPSSTLPAELAPLPWGHHIEFASDGVIARAIRDLGVYELVQAEVLWRLLGDGANFVDVGANIGCMTSLAVARCNPAATIHAFEPHPEIFAVLRRNIARWNRRVDLHEVAASDSAGQTDLIQPPGFEGNDGLSRLPLDGQTEPDASAFRVETTTLDATLSPAPGWVIKIDVEGHEARVLAGAERLLQTRAIDAVLFEEHRPHPSDATLFLHRHGFDVYRLDRSLTGPNLVHPASPPASFTWEPTSYLALPLDRDPRPLHQGGYAVLRRART